MYDEFGKAKRNMVKDIDFDAIDLKLSPPENEPDRQYYFTAKARQYASAESARLGRPLTCCIQTFGCPTV